ncbi:MAG: Ppx/GppA family phosphatase [Proteobacteria bacterium]|nr:Ppx/GppA family phosphatase [Pseudomonadota bacterium]
MTRIAAIDLGTHNCRLMVAERCGGGYKTLKATSRIVRLGEGAGATGRLRPEAMTRTLGALAEFAGIIRDHQAAEVRCVTTEACRRAENREEFIGEIRDRCGLEFEIITEAEEVRLSALATSSLIEARPGRVMTLDIGGGSTELVLLEFENNIITVLDWRSLPLGVVRGRDAMTSPEVSRDEFDDMTRAAARPMAAFFEKNAGFFSEDFQLIATSGTVTTLAALLENLSHYQRRRIDGLKCRVADLTSLAGKTALEPLSKRRANPLMGPDRAELMVPGCAIFSAIFSYIKADFLTAADRGLREGIINSRLLDAPAVVFQKSRE